MWIDAAFILVGLTLIGATLLTILNRTERDWRGIRKH